MWLTGMKGLGPIRDRVRFKRKFAMLDTRGLMPVDVLLLLQMIPLHTSGIFILSNDIIDILDEPLPLGCFVTKGRLCGISYSQMHDTLYLYLRIRSDSFYDEVKDVPMQGIIGQSGLSSFLYVALDFDTGFDKISHCRGCSRLIGSMCGFGSNIGDVICG